MSADFDLLKHLAVSFPWDNATPIARTAPQPRASSTPPPRVLRSKVRPTDLPDRPLTTAAVTRQASHRPSSSDVAAGVRSNVGDFASPSLEVGRSSGLRSVVLEHERAIVTDSRARLKRSAQFHPPWTRDARKAFFVGVTSPIVATAPTAATEPRTPTTTAPLPPSPTTAPKVEAAASSGGISRRRRGRDFGSHLQGAAGLPTTVPGAYHVDGVAAATLTQIGTRGGKRHFANLTKPSRDELPPPPDGEPVLDGIGYDDEYPLGYDMVIAGQRRQEHLAGHLMGAAGIVAGGKREEDLDRSSSPSPALLADGYMSTLQRIHDPELREMAKHAYSATASMAEADRSRWRTESLLARQVHEQLAASQREEQLRAIERAARRHSRAEAERKAWTRTGVETTPSFICSPVSASEYFAQLRDQEARHHAALERERERQAMVDRARVEEDVRLAREAVARERAENEVKRETLRRGIDRQTMLRRAARQYERQEREEERRRVDHQTELMRLAEAEAVQVSRLRRSAFADELQDQAARDEYSRLIALRAYLV
jgi:hypothetical protein